MQIGQGIGSRIVRENIPLQSTSLYVKVVTKYKLDDLRIRYHSNGVTNGSIVKARLVHGTFMRLLSYNLVSQQLPSPPPPPLSPLPLVPATLLFPRVARPLM
jgi:hypothetical protein